MYLLFVCVCVCVVLLTTTNHLVFSPSLHNTPTHLRLPLLLSLGATDTCHASLTTMNDDERKTNNQQHNAYTATTYQHNSGQIVAVIICDTGVALLAYMNGTDPRTLGSVALVVAAALAASIYKV